MTQDPGLASWLQLTLTPGLGAAAIRGLLSQFGQPENILAAPRAQLERTAGPAAAALLRAEDTAPAVEQALRWAQAPGHAIVTLADVGPSMATSARPHSRCESSRRTGCIGCGGDGTPLTKFICGGAATVCAITV